MDYCRYYPSSMSRPPTHSIYDDYTSSNRSSYITTNNTRNIASKFGGSYVSGRPPSGSSGSRSTRPLPNGPGPLNRNNKKMDINQTTSRLKPNTTSSKSYSSSTGPVKATYNPRNYDSHSYKDSSNSYSTSYGSSYHTNGASKLRRDKHYGSSPSLSSRNTPSPVIETKYDVKTQNGKVSTSTHTSTFSLNHNKNLDSSSTFPNINDSDSIGKNYESRNSRWDSHDSDRDASPPLRRTSSASRRSPSLDSFGNRDTVDRLLKTDTGAKNYSRRSSDDYDSLNNNKGLLGLRNLGNTCYMNCMLQGLSNTRVLREYLCSNDWKVDMNRGSRMKGELIRAFAGLVKKMWASGGSSYTSYVSPTDFRSELTRYARRFAGYTQQDAQEFLIFLIEGLHEDVNRIQKKVPKQMLSDKFDKCSAEEKAIESWKWYTSYDNSFMVDLFVGQLKSSLECLSCGYVSNTFDPFWEIPLPLKKKRYGIGGGEAKLSDCFDEFTREETLDGDERPTCENCKKRQACKKKFSIWKFPEILILHLKRFDPMSSYPTKLGTHVDFPITDLNLAPYADNNLAKHECTYDLYSVSNHSGTARGGHYTAYTKHPYNGQWHHFNDQSCSSISSRMIVSSQAYVLFYERQSPRAGKSHL